jgi:hypothetical protein
MISSRKIKFIFDIAAPEEEASHSKGQEKKRKIRKKSKSPSRLSKIPRLSLDPLKLGTRSKGVGLSKNVTNRTQKNLKVP